MTFFLRRMALAGFAGSILGVFALVGAIKLLTWPASARLDSGRPGIPVEAVAISSNSGSRLAAWFAQGRPGAGTVLLMHGVRGNREQVADRMRFLHASGYSVLAFDFQAHGESSGDMITFGRLESLDARAALAWLRQKSPQEKVGAIGISLGGAAALLGAKALDVDALVLEAVYPDIESAIDDRLSARIGPLSRLATPLFIAAGKVITGIYPAELRPIDGLARLRAPVFIMAGVLDRHTRIAETREMFARANAPKLLWEVEGAAHVDLHAFAREEYERRVMAFLEGPLRRSGSSRAD